MTKDEIKDKIIELQDELIEHIRSDELKYIRLFNSLATLKSQLSEAGEEKKEGLTCPRCGKIHSYLSPTCDCPPKTYTANTYEGAEAGEEKPIIKKCRQCRFSDLDEHCEPCESCYPIAYSNWQPR